MKNPQEVIDSMNDKIKRGIWFSSEWPNLSLAWGLPGIACFFAMMNLHFPNEGWEKVVHDYLLLAKQIAEADTSSNLSLFSGLTGLGFTIHLCSQEGSRYKKMLSTVDDILLHEVQTVFFRKADHFLDPHVPIPPNYYNLANGLSGILTYLICRDDHVDLKNLGQECLYYLVKILSGFKEVNGSKVPAWYISPENESVLEYKEKFPNGNFKLDIPNGLPGILAALSLAKMKGFNVFGLTELISKMSEWLKNKQINHTQRINWNPFVPLEDEVRNKSNFLGVHHHAWYYGSPGILRCLYLAAQAIKDSSLAKFAEETLLSNLLNVGQEKKEEDTSFSFGKAGLLAITFQMASDTRNPELFKQARLLEEEIKTLHHPYHEFGFQTLHFDGNDSVRWSHNPSLLHGAAGIGLTLLQSQGKQEMQWLRPFALA